MRYPPPPSAPSRRAFGLLALGAAGLRGQAVEEAEALLRRSAERYRQAKSYLFVAVETTVTESPPERSESVTQVVTATDGKGRSRVEFDDRASGGVAVDDGRARWIYVPRLERFAKLPRERSPAAPGLDFSAHAKRYLDRYGILDQRVRTARVAGRERIGMQTGEADCVVVEAVYNPPPGLRDGRIERSYWLEAGSGAVVRERSTASMTHAGTGRQVTVTQDIAFQAARIDEPVDEGLFVFVPPPGARRTENFEDLGSAAEAEIDAEAPDFTLPSLDGRQVQLSRLRGRVVLLDFWASWCGPCRYDMPFVQALYDKHRARGLEVLGLSADPPERARAYLESNGLTFPSLVDERMRVAFLYQVRAIPTFVVVDRQGRMSAYLQGTRSQVELEAAIVKAGL